MLTSTAKAGFGSNMKVLLKEWRKELLEAFSEPCGNRPWITQYAETVHREGGRFMVNRSLKFDDLSIVVDKKQNIWASSFGSACVGTAKGVINVTFPAAADGQQTPRQSQGVDLLGDGEYVYFPFSDGKSWFARLSADEKVEWTPGPSFVASGRMRPLRDKQGGLWIMCGQQWTPTTGRPGTLVRRYTSPDKSEEVRNAGMPLLADEAGCVWLADREGRGVNQMTIWEPSGKTSTLTIPGRNEISAIVAGPKGEVYAWTTFGLRFLHAKDPSRPSAYELGNVCRLEDMDTGGGLQYSSLGYLVGQDLRHIRLYWLGPESERPRLAASEETAKVDDPAESASPAKPKPAAEPRAASVRTWTDSTGTFTVQAALVKASPTTVTLRKTDGATIDVPFEKLSPADQKWVRRR